MLDILSVWCSENSMCVNPQKSKVVHFRCQSKSRSPFSFTCGNHNLQTVGQYNYLGLLMDEFLDFNKTAKYVAQSASRVLVLVIAKFKAIGSLPYNVFMKLFDSSVWPVISYGASIWETKSNSCINAVQHRAMRFYLGWGSILQFRRYMDMSASIC